jgi:hypothetical protein
MKFYDTTFNEVVQPPAARQSKEEEEEEARIRKLHRMPDQENNISQEIVSAVETLNSQLFQKNCTVFLIFVFMNNYTD